MCKEFDHLNLGQKGSFLLDVYNLRKDVLNNTVTTSAKITPIGIVFMNSNFKHTHYFCCHDSHFCLGCFNELSIEEGAYLLLIANKNSMDIFSPSLSSFRTGESGENIHCGFILARKLLDRIGEKFSVYFSKYPSSLISFGYSSFKPIITLSGTNEKASFEKLLSLCQQAPVGKGTKTIIDLNYRRVLQVRDAMVYISWNGLDEALKKASELVNPGFKLKAEFYKLLIYQHYDNFQFHVDSKKSENHLLTMCVYCGNGSDDDGNQAVCYGGELRFSEDYQEENAIQWIGTTPGDWCCWFNTTPHMVSLVWGGCRIVAIYNILVEEIDHGSSCQKQNIYANVESNNNNNNNIFVKTGIFQLPLEIIKLIVDLMRQNDLYHFSKTCKISEKLFNDSLFLFSHFIGHALSTPNIRKVYCLAGFNRVAFLLDSKYSSDGKDYFDVRRFHGKDDLLYRSLVQNFGSDSVELIECQVEEEKDDNEDYGRSFRMFRKTINPSVFRNGYQDMVNDDGAYRLDLDEYNAEIIGKSRLRDDEIEFLTFFSSVVDDFVGDYCVPYLGVYWLTNQPYFSEHFTRSEREKSSTLLHAHLWGNEGHFSLFSYHKYALVVNLGVVIPPDSLEFDENR